MAIIRLSENAAPLDVQQPADERRPALLERVEGGLAYTLGKSTDNGSDKRNMLWDPYDDTIYEGPSNFDRRHVLSFYYIYDLPFWREPTNWCRTSSAAGRSRAPRSCARARRSRSPGRTIAPERVTAASASRSTWSATPIRDQRQVLDRNSGRADDNFYFNPAAFAQVPSGATLREHATQRHLWPGRSAVGHRAVQEHQPRGDPQGAAPVEVFNFLNHPNLSGPNTDITNANFGRIITKSGDRRDIQLAVRYEF